MKMTNEEILTDWQALKAYEEGKELQVKSGEQWFDSPFINKAALIEDLFTNHYCFRLKPELINIEWTASFDIDEKTSVKHKISYKVDDLGKPIKDTIKVEKL